MAGVAMKRRRPYDPNVPYEQTVLWRAPGCDTRFEVHALLFERGCPLWTHRLYRGPDGMWRGSGMEVSRG